MKDPIEFSDYPQNLLFDFLDKISQIPLRPNLPTLKQFPPKPPIFLPLFKSIPSQTPNFSPVFPDFPDKTSQIPKLPTNQKNRSFDFEFPDFPTQNYDFRQTDGNQSYRIGYIAAARFSSRRVSCPSTFFNNNQSSK